MSFQICKVTEDEIDTDGNKALESLPGQMLQIFLIAY